MQINPYGLFLFQTLVEIFLILKELVLIKMKTPSMKNVTCLVTQKYSINHE